MPAYTVVLRKDGIELPAGIQQSFESAANTPNFAAELLYAFSEAGGIPSSGNGWTHMQVYDGYVGGKQSVPDDLKPVINLTRDDVQILQDTHHIRFRM